MRVSGLKVPNERVARFITLASKLNNIRNTAVTKYHLTASRYAVLYYLHTNGDNTHSMSEVAGDLNWSPSNLTMLCDRLEEGGWVVRAHSTMDRRVCTLALTDKAKAEFPKIIAEVAKAEFALNQALEKITAEFDNVEKLLMPDQTTTEVKV